MTKVRTPPSLNWLIKKKAKLLGTINNIEKTIPVLLTYSQTNLDIAETKYVESIDKHNKNLAFKNKIPKLKTQLEALEIALSMHEVQINSQLIMPRGTHRPCAYGSQGSLTRGIYECLKLRGIATTKEITLFILAKNELDVAKIDLNEMRIAVRKRLRALVDQGKLERLHATRTIEEGIWKIPS